MNAIIALLVLSLALPDLHDGQRVPAILGGECQYGLVIAYGRQVVFIGDQWQGTGEIGPDGVLRVSWFDLVCCRRAVGEYREQSDGWAGRWKRLDEPEPIEEVGRLETLWIK